MKTIAAVIIIALAVGVLVVTHISAYNSGREEGRNEICLDLRMLMKEISKSNDGMLAIELMSGKAAEPIPGIKNKEKMTIVFKNALGK